MHAVHGRDTWIAVQPEHRSHYTGYCLEDVGTHPADALPINIGASALRVLLGERWPRLRITREKAGDLKIVIEGSGCLRLERLPAEGESLEWPKRIDEEMRSYRPLSSKSIRDIDPVYRATPMWSDDPAVLKERIDEAIDEVLAISLDPRVPKEVRQMFEVVKSAAAYGYFYRPLTTLAASQVYSIEDAALYHRCLSAAIKPPKTFHQRIEALLRAGIIPPYEAHVWHAKRDLRNSVAHRTHQWLMWPGMDFSSLEISAMDINNLFVPIFEEEPATAAA